MVAYDHVRGEKQKGRGKIIRKEDRPSSGKGDCIDCKLCVDVCPTGIDIRNGTQLECVNCTACIDACNEVMEKVKFKPHLIKYASFREITQRDSKRWTTRLKAYTAALVFLLGVFVFFVLNRSYVETDFYRLSGQLYTVDKQTNSLQNVFTFKILNKSTESLNALEFKLINISDGKIYTVNKQKIDLAAEEILDGTVFVELPLNTWQGKPKKLQIGIYQNNTLIDKAKIRFIGPRKYTK